MQNKKNFISLVLLIILSLGCAKGSDSFEAEIKKARKAQIATTSLVGEGPPYFLPNTLTPHWELNREKVTIPSFSLIDQDGHPVSDEVFVGKITVVGFFFTTCAGFCPLLFKKMQSLAKKWESQKDIQFVLFSVDPTIDTPEQMKLFAKRNGVINFSKWKLITGNESTIYQLIRETFASEVKKLANMRKFAHTEQLYFIDRQKHLRGIVGGTLKDLHLETKELLDSLDREHRSLSRR